MYAYFIVELILVCQLNYLHIYMYVQITCDNTLRFKDQPIVTLKHMQNMATFRLECTVLSIFYMHIYVCFNNNMSHFS